MPGSDRTPRHAESINRALAPERKKEERKMTKKFAAAALAATFAATMFCAAAAQAAGPSGFGAASGTAPAGAPQGFEPAATTVADILANGKDDQVVVLRGKFTNLIKSDKYEFVDEKGDAITAELDDDRDWSMIVKDAPVEIRAEIDRDWTSTELDVKSARPLK